MASATVFEISRLELQKLDLPASASIIDVKSLSSYNWIEAPKATPTIAIPGSPPLWSDPRSPLRVKKDSGLFYIAQNAARHPESPLEPLFRALYVTNPSFDIRSTDVVTDRNNIRKLLSFIDPRLNRNGQEAFTINIEVMKSTAIFHRDETKTMEYIGPGEFRGFGHEYEKTCTRTQIEGSTGHHRIISYHFGGLNFVVRHATDGYVATGAESPLAKLKKSSEEDLSSLLGAIRLSPADRSPNDDNTGSKLRIKRVGQAVPLNSILEIKTRVFHKSINIDEVMPQLWASQTPKLVRSYHRNGIFQSPVVEDMTAVITSWERRKQTDLRKLAALIRRIIHLAKELGGKAVLIFNVEADKLVLSKVDRKDMLPEDLYKKMGRFQES